MNSSYLAFKEILFDKEELLKAINLNIKLTQGYFNGQKINFPEISYDYSWFFTRCSNPLYVEIINSTLEYANNNIVNDCTLQPISDTKMLKDMWYDYFMKPLVENGVKKP